MKRKSKFYQDNALSSNTYKEEEKESRSLTLILEKLGLGQISIIWDKEWHFRTQEVKFKMKV